MKRSASMIGMMVLLAVFMLIPASAQADSAREGWLWPVCNDERHLSRGYNSGHRGLDINRVYYNTVVRAAKAGNILMVYTGCTNDNAYTTHKSCTDQTCNPSSRNRTKYGDYSVCNWGFGNGIVIEHDDGTVTEYAHMSEVYFTTDDIRKSKDQKGTRVEKGQALGLTGSTGNSQAAHLHFSVWSGYSPKSYGNPGQYYTPVTINNNPSSGSFHVVSTGVNDAKKIKDGYFSDANGVKYEFGATLTWSTPVTQSVGKSDATIRYSFQYANMKGKIDEISCTLSAPDLNKTWNYTIAKNVSLSGESGEYPPGTIKCSTITGGQLVPNVAYTCVFRAKFKDTETNEQKDQPSPDCQFTTAPYKHNSRGNGQWFVVNLPSMKIRDTAANLITLKSTKPGDCFEVAETDGDTVTVYYDGNKKGKLAYGAGVLYTPIEKTVYSRDPELHSVPIHESYYKKASLIKEDPPMLNVGDRVIRLCEYQNDKGNWWSYIVDSHGHKGWVWNTYLTWNVPPDRTVIGQDGTEVPEKECPEEGNPSIFERISEIMRARQAAKDAKSAVQTVDKTLGEIGKKASRAASAAVTGMSFRFSSPTPTDDSAYLEAYATPKSAQRASRHWTQTGIRVWDAETGDEVALHGPTVDEQHSYRLETLKIYYRLKEDLGAELIPGTTYRYRIYTVCDGATYWSQDQYFTTTGHRTCHVTFDSDGGTTVPAQDIRYKSPLPGFEMIKSELVQSVVLHYVFRGWYRDAARTVPFLDTDRVTEDMTLYAKWELEKPIVDVTSIALDRTSGTIYANSVGDDILNVTATLQPSDATFTDVLWTTSDPGVANTDQYGHIVAVGPGTAEITCASVMTPGVKASCTVTVKQRMSFLYLAQGAPGLCVGDSARLTTGCVPENATETAVTWSSSDPSVAMVDAEGNVTALALGEATISCTSVENASLKAACPVRVEKALALNLYPQRTQLYLNGEAQNTVAYVIASNDSIMRCETDNWEWSLDVDGASAEIEWEALTTVVPVNSIEGYADTGVRIDTTALCAAGTTAVTVTCTNDLGTDTVTFDVTVAELTGMPAAQATLAQTEYSVQVGDAVTIPARPQAADSGTLPEVLSLTLAGTTGMERYASFEEGLEGITVRFNESGIYNVDAEYASGNLSYKVPLTFTVSDENGVVHLPVTEVTVAPETVSLLIGEGTQLSATAGPEEAWDKTLVWTSSDPAVATVDQTGVVTAVSVGSAVIAATAADGGDASDAAVIRVESVVQLSENDIQFDIYRNGLQEMELCGLALTTSSYARLLQTGEAISWELARVSEGEPVTALGIEGREGYATLKLLRILGTGNDTYKITCRAGQHEDSCLVALTVTEDALPESVSAAQTAVTAQAGEGFTLDAAPVCSPQLPEDTLYQLSGGAALMTNLSELTYDGTTVRAKIERPGVYQAELVYFGANYRYCVPVAITVNEAGGNPPVMPDSLAIDREALFLTSGDTCQLTASFMPANASDQTLQWSAADDEIASVSESGLVTAVTPGSTVVTGVNSVSGLSVTCVVHVEDSLTLEEYEQEYEVYVEGMTRTRIGGIRLTEASSLRLSGAPAWTLKRVSGSGLTLRVSGTTFENESGDTLYGADIELYSISAIGETVYELTCAANGETAAATIIVNGKSRSGSLPTAVTAEITEYSADENELIQVVPSYVLTPAETSLPAGITTTWEYGAAFAEAMNAGDCVFNHTISTFSFSEAGRYEAELILSAGNVRYGIPMTFYIKNGQGEVPVNGEMMRLSETMLDLEAGDTATLVPVFTPADVTNRAVTWTSNNLSVATVDDNGTVTAVANGSARITCTPADSHLRARTCDVRVEDYLEMSSSTPSTTSNTWYLEGDQENAAGSMLLTAGTVKRMERDGLEPQWTLTRTSGNNAELELYELPDGSGVNILTSSLRCAGTDEYTLTLTAGEHTLSQSYTLTVQSAGNAPESVTIAQTRVNAQTGTPVTIDFTPICSPAGTAIPSSLAAVPHYVGFGGYYSALDAGASSVSSSNAQARVCFSKPGVYLLTRYYKHRNLKYITACEITVGEPEEETLGLLSADNTDCAVFLGGKSGAIARISVTDSGATSLWGGRMTWSAEQISGDEVTASLETGDTYADLFVADASVPGIAVWRVTCAFGSVTESIDITIRIKRPYYTLPESIQLLTNELNGRVGDMMVLPLAAVCAPTGSRLPEMGDAYWRFTADGKTGEKAECEIKGGLFRALFRESGYYTGYLTYQNGNVHYTVPVYFTVRDEEDVTPVPELSMFALNVPATVYPEGDTGIAIGVIAVSESLNTYNAGTAPSYMSSHPAEWHVSTDEGKLALSLREATPNTRTLILNGINGSGDAGYAVRCTVDGTTYTTEGTIHIAEANEDRPDATLARGTYTLQVGDTVRIQRALYDRRNKSMLLSSSTWNADTLLSAIGYEYETDSTAWTATFYKTGTYNSSVTGYVGNLRVEAPLTVIVRGGNESVNLPVLKLPAGIREIGEEAFAGNAVYTVDLRGTNIDRINENAFRNCLDLERVYLPNGNIAIADSAFYGCMNVVFVCAEDSPAAAWAFSRGIPVEAP